MTNQIVINLQYMQNSEVEMENHTSNSQLTSSIAIQNSDISVLNFNFPEKPAIFQSFSLKSINLNEKFNGGFSQSFLCDSDNKMHSQDDPLFKVLSLTRGTSQNISQSQDCKQISNFIYEQPTAVASTTSMIQSQLIAKQKDQFFNDSLISQSSPAQTPFYEINNSLMEKCFLNQLITPIQKKQSTKNVTKNMGKLLFKFIWKNKEFLRQRLSMTKQKWEQFMFEVKKWKKQNNITRQFLKNRWHGTSQDCRLFRIISHNFFRSRFYQAIFKSKIEHKEIHIERLHRFQKGIRDESALNNLN